MLAGLLSACGPQIDLSSVNLYGLEEKRLVLLLNLFGHMQSWGIHYLKANDILPSSNAGG